MAFAKLRGRKEERVGSAHPLLTSLFFPILLTELYCLSQAMNLKLKYTKNEIVYIAILKKLLDKAQNYWINLLIARFW